MAADKATAPKESTVVDEKKVDPKVDQAAVEAKALERADIPPVITTSEQYDRVFRYLATRYHVLTPVSAFSGMAPQHGLVVAKVQLDSDPNHGEVYQDKLFCKTGSRDPLDDEVAIAKVGLRKLAIAGGWNLTADVLKADRNYWVVRAYNRFVGLDGSVQTFSATEEYDLRDGSPQVRGFGDKQKEAARAHGLRGGEARAFNAACREFGIKQKYTRRELLKPFVIMRMMFIPDASNELQMRIVTERALQGTSAMFPQQAPVPIPLESIEGMSAPIDIEGQIVAPPPAAAAEPKPQTIHVDGVPTLPPGFTLIQRVTTEEKKRRNGEGSFTKWTAVDMNGEEFCTVKKDIGKGLMACWNQQDWKKGRPVEISAHRNDYKENEIDELNPISQSADDEPSFAFAD